MKIKLNRKGMEMWQLVLIILALISLVVFIFFYAGLGNEAKELIKKLGEIF